MSQNKTNDTIGYHYLKTPEATQALSALSTKLEGLAKDERQMNPRKYVARMELKAFFDELGALSKAPTSDAFVDAIQRGVAAVHNEEQGTYRRGLKKEELSASFIAGKLEEAANTSVSIEPTAQRVAAALDMEPLPEIDSTHHKAAIERRKIFEHAR